MAADDHGNREAQTGWHYADLAIPLFENGYFPIPLKPGSKAPAVPRWSDVVIDAAQLKAWVKRYPNHGVGLRTGVLVGIDIDCLDPDHAHTVMQEATCRFGATLLRVGLWPKRLLLYRTTAPFPKMRKLAGVEVLGVGQQLVAFGVHPETGSAYYWPDGDTPLDVSLSDLPVVAEEEVRGLLTDCAAMAGAPSRPFSTMGTVQRSDAADHNRCVLVRDKSGRVTDGRDGWLSTIAYHVVWDAIDAGAALEPSTLGNRVWQRFAAGTDLSRPRKDGRAHYACNDAARKVADKLRLQAEGRLPPRAIAAPDREPPPPFPTLTVTEGRDALAKRLASFCDEVLRWHTHENAGRFFPPRLGLRATVGLGKSVASRLALQRLQTLLKAEGHPHRILIAVPSHKLAEETADAWRSAGVHAEVLRGYERTDPSTGAPMCRNIKAVRLALASNESVPKTCCWKDLTNHCRYFHGCLKHKNKKAVEAAAVVVVAYDILQIAVDPNAVADRYALLVVDEACWPRSIQRDRLPLAELRHSLQQLQLKEGSGDDALLARRTMARLLDALDGHPEGRMAHDVLVTAGLSPDDLGPVRSWLATCLTESGLFPGAGAGVIRAAKARTIRNKSIQQLMCLLDKLGPMLADGMVQGGDLIVERCAEDQINLHIGSLAPIAAAYAAIPLLHLDATLRSELAERVLPPFETETIEVASPHTHLRLVHGRFGKAALCPKDAATEAQKQTATRRLEQLVIHVSWLTRLRSPRRTLVITYKAVEVAFADIPYVDVAHFNAIAGLDCYGDVAQIILIGRPVPDPLTIGQMTGALFQHAPEGSYTFINQLVRMRNGATRPVRVMQHEDLQAELLRAAICDDELIQAIGRGRGVNRTSDNPLAVHVLADVALPLVHDQITHWDLERPDILQRMLLAGMAVDSPADAAALHPDLFETANQAKLMFQREGIFKGQTLINTYKEMTLKSARYRRAGRGRNWQRAWWIEGDASAIRLRMETALGRLAGWELD